MPHISETQEHLVIATYFKKVGLGGVAIACHIRNERTGHAQRIMAARMGIMKGMPDWLIIDAGRAGFLELKPRGWKAKRAKTANYTPHELIQLETHRRLKVAGAWVEICETLDEVLDVLRHHGVPLRQESITTERIRAGFMSVNDARDKEGLPPI
jgi:hypothetical protein